MRKGLEQVWRALQGAKFVLECYDLQILNTVVCAFITPNFISYLWIRTKIFIIIWLKYLLKYMKFSHTYTLKFKKVVLRLTSSAGYTVCTRMLQFRYFIQYSIYYDYTKFYILSIITSWNIYTQLSIVPTQIHEML